MPEEVAMYDPRIGRWMTEDPIEFEAADPDLYRYVHNDPTNATDPSGLQTRKLSQLKERMVDSDIGEGGKSMANVHVKDEGKVVAKETLSLGAKDNAIALCLTNASFTLGFESSKLKGLIRFGVVSEDPQVIKVCRWLQYIKVNKPKGTTDVGIDTVDDKGQKRYIPWDYWTLDTGDPKDPFYDSGPLTGYLRENNFVIASDRINPASGIAKETGEGLTGRLETTFPCV
jgi:uncharacterized protein RhaS with RHS repeats